MQCPKKTRLIKKYRIAGKLYANTAQQPRDRAA